MLRELLTEEFEQYVEYAYELEMDLSNITFHIYTDGIKTKQDFLNHSKRALERENHKIFLYEKDGKIEGWIHYYFIKESNNVTIENMAIEKGFQEALDELLTYWREHHNGYQWNFYIPNQNEDAMHYMRSKGYLSEDVEIVDVLHFSNYTYQEVSGNFVKITSDNYHLFRELHQHYDAKMYWTSDRILNCIDRWNIYGYVEDGRCLGAIYYMDVGNNMLEIFGIDGPNGVCNLDISKKLLLYCLNEGKQLGYEHMYFFCERDIHEKAIEVGFEHITDSYYCNGMCE